MTEDLMTAPAAEASAPPSLPPAPPEAPVAEVPDPKKEPGSMEWVVEQFDQLNTKMDRIINRFM